MDFDNSDGIKDRAQQILSLSHQIAIEQSDGDAQSVRALTPLCLQCVLGAATENAIDRLIDAIVSLRSAATTNPINEMKHGRSSS